MNLIADIRKKHEIKQSELVRRLGWKQSRLGNYENHSRVPGLAESRAIVLALNTLGAPCTLDDVFPPSGDYQQNQAA